MSRHSMHWDMKTEAEKFLDEIEAFLEKHDIPASRFGMTVMGNPTFVFELRKGAQSKLSTVDKCRRYMAEFKSERRPTRRGSASVAA